MRNVKTLGAVASALVLTAGLATTASAAEMKFKVSGYYKGAFIVSSLNDGYQGTAVGADGEIHFSPSIKTDNGVTYGARIELEAFTASDQIDEHYIFAKGGFGTVKIGADDGAHYLLHSQAPGGGYDSYNEGTFSGTWGTMYVNDYSSSDANKLTYMTPNMNGIVIGVSFTPDTTSGGGLNTNKAASNVKDTGYGDGMAVGVRYKTSMDGVSVQLGAGFQSIGSDSGGEDREVLQGHAKFGIGGVTVGGSYLTDNKASTTTDLNAFNIGVSYKMGDLTIGGGMGAMTTETSGSQDDTDTHASVSFSYAVAPGVKAGAGLHFEENDGQDDDAVGAVMAIQMSF
jgi:hypothetical protein